MPTNPPPARAPLSVMIVSGGQTGVDRGALDAAREARAPCGGWCPEGRKAEDGPIDARYRLRELPGAGYLQRTRKNVEDSDGTLILTFGEPSGGTARTLEFCRQLGKPHRVINADVVPVDLAAQQALAFLIERAVRRLNVAGPRASGEPRAYAYSYGVILKLLRIAGHGASALAV